jgi:hypothetical protein
MGDKNMCNQIDAEFVLANYFLHSSEPLTFGKLRKIRHAIESNAEEPVYVDVSTPSLASAIEMYPQMFRWAGDEIVKSEDSGSFFNEGYVKGRFSYGLDDRICQRARQAIANLPR